MIFKVPKDLQGSYVLSTLNRVLAAGNTVSICGNDLYAADVKAAVENGSLVPVSEKYDTEKMSYSDTAILMNRTGKLLILGNISLRPEGALPISKNDINSLPIQAAKRDGLVEIISDEDYEEKPKPKKRTPKKKAAKKKTKSKNVEVVEIKEEEKEESKTGGDKDVTPTVWNFKTQKLTDAEVPPKTPDPFMVNKEETQEVDFIEEKPKTSKKKKKIKKKVKKTKKKKVAKKTIKKKGKTSKKKKIKSIEPVGEVKPEKTVTDAIVELDSRGNPIEKASDTLQHLIDSLGEPEDVEFVDNEQAQERLNKRTDM